MPQLAHTRGGRYPVVQSTGLPNLRTGLRRNRLLALVAACMLIACSAVYSAHGLADRSHEHSHCDVCVHFGGCAGSPPPATAIGKPGLVVRVAPAPPAIHLPHRPPAGPHLPP